MRGLFLTVLDMSMTAGYVILLVMAARLMLKRAPKSVAYGLWSVVAFRLVVPFSWQSIFSLMPRSTKAVSIPRDIFYQQSMQIDSGIRIIDSLASQSLSAPLTGTKVNLLQVYLTVGTCIWILGMMALITYGLLSFFVIKKQLKGAQHRAQNIYEAENLKTPFVLGFISPKIYLPAGLHAAEQSYILLHEQTHIRRKDPIIKAFAFLLLAMHWFNPLVWLAFLLMGADMELSCDEQILKKMHPDIKKPYANSLLSLAAGGHQLNGGPLAFGQGNIKGRIKNVLSYQKPKHWVIVLAVILAIGVGIGLITNPGSLSLGSLIWGSTNASMPQHMTGYMVIEGDLLHLDEVEIITREDTKRIKELELELGERITTPSGYHIHNADSAKQTFRITNKTTYTFVDYGFLFLRDGEEDRLYTTTKKEEFILHLKTAYSDSPPAQKVPFFIEVKDGKVVSITEEIQFTI